MQTTKALAFLMHPVTAFPANRGANQTASGWAGGCIRKGPAANGQAKTSSGINHDSPQARRDR